MFLCLAICFSPSAVATQHNQSNIDDFLKLSIEELLNVPITSTSLFNETSLTAGSTVAVITDQDWEKRGARRLNDAIINLPSVIALPNFLAQDSVRIRGYALSDARGIATIWDGVSITSFNLGTSDVDRPNIQLNTLDSIEVTRGPGSALYGSDAFHGVVALKSFESEKNANIVKGRIATNGFYAAGYNGSQSLGNDWRINLSVSTSGQPDQDIAYSNTSGSGVMDFNYQSSTFVAKLNSDENKTWSYKFGIYYDDNDTNDFHGQGGQGGDPDNDVASVEADMVMYKFDVNYNLSNHSSLSLETYYWDQHHIFERPASPTNNIFLNGDEHREAAQIIYRNEKFTKNTQLSAAFGMRHDKIDLQRRKVFNATTTIVEADLPFSGSTRKINSFLIDGKTDFAEKKWILRYGFRLDDYSDFGSQFTPRLGVIYSLDSSSVVKALYGQSFRAAAANEVGGTAFITGNPNIQPEELDTIELIYLKQKKNFKFEAVLFSSEWKNGIAAVDTNNDTIDDTFANVTRSNSYGLELTLLNKIEKWLIEASASYVKSESETDNADYMAFPGVIINLGIGYDFISGWKLYVNNRVHLDAKEGPVRNAIVPDDLEDYWRTDVNLTKSFKDKWQLYANIRNVFDRKNYLPSLVNTEGGVPQEEISMDIGFKFSF